MSFELGASPAAPPPPASFPTRILPILTKAGCNSGACHGAATGQGGFKLSLLGYDPAQDHLNITRESGARRLNLDEPAESLFLRKPTRDRIDHEGDRRFRRDSEAAQTLLRWIAAGAPYGPAELRVTGIEVSPRDTLLESTNASVQLRVTAQLSDGNRADATALALYTSNDDALADVSGTGLVTTRRPGITSIMVRYGGQVAAANITVPIGPTPLSRDIFPGRNFIDEAVFAGLARLRLPPSPLSSDAEFLRRFCLDLSGRLPASEDARAFLAEPASAEKRERKIDELLHGEAFVDLWTMRLSELLLISGKRGSEAATRAYHGWLREQVARNTPFDEVVRTLLTASGRLVDHGPANFFTLAEDPRDLAEHVGNIFLGTRIGCARCHAHPTDRWTQDDYHHFAACFARVSRDGELIRVASRGEVEHPKTRVPMAPLPLGAATFPGSDATDRRAPLAAWLTAPENPYFARATVNRVWKHLLGRGLVEPVDDLRPTNPPSNPALLDALAGDFGSHAFDLRRLIRLIVTSRTYQLSSRATALNAADDRAFSHAYLKPLAAPVFLDAVAQVTGVPDHFADQPEAARAVQLVGVQTPSYALDVLGRCPRERSCETAGAAGGGVTQALHLIHGDTINARLHGGIIAQLHARAATRREIVEELYLRALTRFPEAPELVAWERMLTPVASTDIAADEELLEDLLWSLLNSREFAFNH